MRKLLLLSACSIACSFGAAICGSDNANIVGVANYSCTYQGLTFSNFAMTVSGNQASTYTPDVEVTGTGVNSFGEVYLNFNPNMAISGTASGPNNTLDAYFYFTVTAANGITGIDLGNSGINTTITERVCATAFDGQNGCAPPGVIGTLIAANVGQNQAPSHVAMGFGNPQYSSSVSPIYVWKDINLISQGADGAGISLFSQSFMPGGGSGGPGGGPVPEPLTFLSVGGGLIAVVLYTKRKSVKQ